MNVSGNLSRAVHRRDWDVLSLTQIRDVFRCSVLRPSSNAAIDSINCLVQNRRIRFDLLGNIIELTDEAQQIRPMVRVDSADKSQTIGCFDSAARHSKCLRLRRPNDPVFQLRKRDRLHRHDRQQFELIELNVTSAGMVLFQQGRNTRRGGADTCK